ncbi:hypothetical protein H4R18_001175 [Coemansia javaensis]|uniref:Uncharacterized protein n=1 Tax=Coemansia javaensis TaxID=2761396 RepID=A0A9W8HDT8_9FUNG|nr:hypothetical protein H4R18_001175 [Coemansia javaensis]
MRSIALVCALAACAVAAPLRVRQLPGDTVNGPTALSNPNINNGAQEEGVVDAGLSFNGAQLVHPVGNDFVEMNQNSNFHDNVLQNPTFNVAQDTDGPAVVGNGNRVLRVRQHAPHMSSVNAPAAIDSPTVNNGALREGSLDAGLSADGAVVVDPIGNDLTQVNQNEEVAGNNFQNPNWNTISGNNGPALSGNNNIFVPVTNEQGAIQIDNGPLLDAALSGAI